MELTKDYINAGLAKSIPWQRDEHGRTDLATKMAGLEAMRKCVDKPISRDEFFAKGYHFITPGLAKGFVQSGSAITGLTQYDLEQGARLLYPLTTIFRNMIPRMTGGLGIQANWRSVTAINASRVSIGLSEGHRGAAMAQTVTNNLAQFYTLGMDNFRTEQAYMAALTFEDLNSLMHTTLLQGVMEGEELVTMGGNNSLQLGITPTPAGTPAITGGTLADGSTYSVICVALTFDGMTRSTVAAGVMLPYTRTNLDGSTDLIQGFSAQKSAASSAVNVSGGTGHGSITATVAAVTGAMGYAWFLGLTAGTEQLVAITGYPAVTMTALNAGGQLATVTTFSTDTSTSGLNYNGFLTQFLTSGSGAYVKDLAGSPLTSAGSGTGRITEFDNAIASFITTSRLVPTDVFMSPVDMKAAGALVLTGNTNLAPFIMTENGLTGGSVFQRYVNASGFGNATLDMHAHPFIPPGTIVFWSKTNPYPISNVPTLIRMLLRRDYWSVDWPVTTMQTTTGVYFDGCLQCYFPPAFGLITGVRAAGT